MCASLPISPAAVDEFTVYVHNERGEITISVDSPEAEKVFSASSQEDEDGEFWPVRDGFMKHVEDFEGLRNHLVSLGIMKEVDTLVSP